MLQQVLVEESLHRALADEALAGGGHVGVVLEEGDELVDPPTVRHRQLQRREETRVLRRHRDRSRRSRSAAGDRWR